MLPYTAPLFPALQPVRLAWLHFAMPAHPMTMRYARYRWPA